MHKTWQTLISFTSAMANNYGGVVVEKETGKRMDWGQALCREVYGPGWNEDPKFLEENEIPNTEPAPAKSVAVAKSWAGGEWPDWVDKEAMGVD